MPTSVATRTRSMTTTCSLVALLLLTHVPAAVPAWAGEAASEGRSTMELVSSAFDAGGRIPIGHTCDGEDVSPPLMWEGVPEGVESFALIMDDPDAPPGTWVHWVLYGLPADTRRLEANLPKTETLDIGAVQGACWGVSSYSRVGYYGPCPPPGGPHRYFFRLFALDSALDLSPGQTKDELLKAMEGHVLARAELIGRYGR